MQRGNAVKALRSEASRLEREGRISAVQSMEEGPSDPLLSTPADSASRQRWRVAGNVVGASIALRGAARQRAERPPSFFESHSLITTPGTGLRRTLESINGEEHQKKIPPFWSPKTDAVAIWGLFTGSYLNIMLVLVPLGYLSSKLEWGATYTFCLNFFGIIPLALILGEVTEDLALRSGEVVGGLVNATFGNVVELILSCVALTKNKPALNAVASLSNLGSILSNLLLVLGCCFLAGGITNHMQSFNALGNQVCNSLLFLAVVGLALPCAAGVLPNVLFSSDDMLIFSRIIAVLLLAVYLAYLYFQLISHNDLFAAVKAPPDGPPSGGNGGGVAAVEEADEEEEELPVLTITAELGVLAAISITVAMASELITDSIQDMAKTSGLTTNFLSIVLLPLAGNAVEHITAVMVAMKNKMDLALGIAIGSSLQIALFVLPTCVLFSWGIGNAFTLELEALGTLALAVAIIHANFITASGRSHYLMGVQLICTYLIISTAFLFTRDR